MIIDFSLIYNTYNINSYTKESFADTPCPKCFAVGRFNLHGSYLRYFAYFVDKQIVLKSIELKRVKCRSCKSTHAVMPGDLIPYRLLSLLVVIFILTALFIEKTPVLKLAELFEFSFQFIYSCLQAFYLFRSRIHQYFMETSPTDTPPDNGPGSIMSLIKIPYIEFQYGYTKLNQRPCFMCKFFNKYGAPPIGTTAP